LRIQRTKCRCSYYCNSKRTSWIRQLFERHHLNLNISDNIITNENQLTIVVTFPSIKRQINCKDERLYQASELIKNDTQTILPNISYDRISVQPIAYGDDSCGILLSIEVKGLPTEVGWSFKAAVMDVLHISWKRHKAFNFYSCELLPNSSE